MEICKRPTNKNISTAQGAYTRKNSNNIHTTTKIHIHLLHHTHTNMHAHSTYTRKVTCVQHVGIDTGNRKCGQEGGGGVGWQSKQRNLGVWSMG